MSVPQVGVSTTRLGLTVAAALAIGTLGATAAGAAFSDVPPENQNAEHITSVQEAGIATGFPDGSFRPRQALTRQQAATWIDRSAGRVGLDLLGDGTGTIQLDAANPDATLAEMEMSSPAAGDGQGWVTVQGGAGGAVLDPGQGCPCIVRVHVRDETDQILGTTILNLTDDSAYDINVTPVIAITPIGAGETHTYRIDLELLDPTATVVIGGAAYASYAPMAIGDPDVFGESSQIDPVESMVPEGLGD